jgi:hypothetical protein
MAGWPGPRRKAWLDGQGPIPRGGTRTGVARWPGTSIQGRTPTSLEWTVDCVKPSRVWADGHGRMARTSIQGLIGVARWPGPSIQVTGLLSHRPAHQKETRRSMAGWPGPDNQDAVGRGRKARAQYPGRRALSDGQGRVAGQTGMVDWPGACIQGRTGVAGLLGPSTQERIEVAGWPYGQDPVSKAVVPPKATAGWGQPGMDS